MLVAPALLTLAALLGDDVPAASVIAQDDSGLILFESNRNGLEELYTMRPDGSEKRRLTFNRARDISAAWSRDGQIVFSRGLRNWELFRIDRNGDETRLTSTTADEINADWSPDGTEIVFERQRKHDADLYTLNIGTRRERELATSKRPEITPAWSPNGREVAYAEQRGRDFEIVIANVDTGERRVRTHNRSDDVRPQWAPGGRMIVFTRTRGDESVLVRSRSRGKGRHEEVLRAAPNDAFSVSWSPNGQSIVFSAPNSRDRLVRGEYEVFRMDLPTGTIQQLTTSFPGRDVATDWSAAAGGARRALRFPPDPPASYCTWTGRAVGDTWHGTASIADVLCGKQGNDVLYGDGKNDTLKAGLGNDKLYGEAGNDDLVTRGDGPGDFAGGGTGANEAWIDCKDDHNNTAWRCG